jgi:transcription elongation factor Elf1
MTYEQLEHSFHCPYCAEPISMLLDLSVPAQSFVEDCENCCHPIQITYAVEDGAVIAFSAERAQ